MPKPGLSSSEKCLILLAVIVVLTAIAMAGLIGLILPYHWTRDGYVCCSDATHETLLQLCRCYRIDLSNRTLAKPADCFLITASGECARSKPVLKPKTRPTITHKYVVWLSIPSFADDVGRRYACNGVIMQEDVIVIPKDCIKETSELKSLLVRAGSKSWTKGGTIHQTGEILNAYTDTFELKVLPPFEIGKKVDTLPAVVKKNGNLQNFEEFVNEVKINRTVLEICILKDVTKEQSNTLLNQ